MRHTKKAVAIMTAVMTMAMTFTTPMFSFADESFGAVTATTVDAGNGAPKTVTNVNSPANLDLGAVVKSARLDALGEGNTPPDPILGVTPMLHYELRDAAQNKITGTESNLNTYLYSPHGFSSIYFEHQGIARFYYRAYTKKHGWFPWQNSKEGTPNGDNSDKIQALQIRVKGYTGTMDDVYYKVVLNDGTSLDWAKNGQTTGTIGTDKYIVAIKIALWHNTETFPQATSVLMEANNYEGTYIGADGKVAYSTASGAPYTGWAFYNNDQYYFHEGQRVTGWQYIDGLKFYFNEDGTVARDLEPIMGLTGDYQIKYNKSTRTMTIYAKDGKNGYIIPFKTFMGTSSTDTPVGSFKTYAKYRWKIMHDNIYCQYLNRFKDGFIIHSLIYYDAPNSNKLDPNTYNYMDDASSAGCIRLKAGDAAWVYSNTPLSTPVIIFEDQWNKGPIEKPAIDKPIPLSQHYDPTDPVMIAQQQATAANAK